MLAQCRICQNLQSVKTASSVKHSKVRNGCILKSLWPGVWRCERQSWLGSGGSGQTGGQLLSAHGTGACGTRDGKRDFRFLPQISTGKDHSVSFKMRKNSTDKKQNVKYP